MGTGMLAESDLKTDWYVPCWTMGVVFENDAADSWRVWFATKLIDLAALIAGAPKEFGVSHVTKAKTIE